MKSESLTVGTGAVVFPTCWQQPQPGEGTRTGAGGSGGSAAWPAARRLARSSRADLGLSTRRGRGSSFRVPICIYLHNPFFLYNISGVILVF